MLLFPNNRLIWNTDRDDRILDKFRNLDWFWLIGLVQVREKLSCPEFIGFRSHLIFEILDVLIVLVLFFYQNFVELLICPDVDNVRVVFVSLHPSVRKFVILTSFLKNQCVTLIDCTQCVEIFNLRL